MVYMYKIKSIHTKAYCWHRPLYKCKHKDIRNLYTNSIPLTAGVINRMRLIWKRQKNIIG